MKSFQTQTHYEVLEISVGATETEVRSAYQRLSLLYSDDQVVLYGLIDPARATALRNRLQEALEVLTDDQRRDAYDLKIGLPPRMVVPKPVPAAPKPSAPGPAAGASAGTGWGSFSWVTPSGPEHTPTQPSAYTYAVAPPKPVAAPPPPAKTAPIPVLVKSAPVPAPVKSAPVPAPVKSAPVPVLVKSAPVPEPIAPVEPPEQRAPVVSAVEVVDVSVPAAEPVVAPPEPSPEPPRQLALDVSSGVAGWGSRVAPAPEPEAVEGSGPEVLAELEPMPVAAASAPVMVEPVLQAAPPPLPPPPRASSPELPLVVGQPLPPTPLPEPLPPAPEPAVAPAEEPAVPMLGDDVQVAIIPARATPSREFRVEQRPRPYEVPEGVEINGDLLRQVRMARGLSLVQVADRTRIGVKHLENVEADRYDALPAAVYLRGILMNLARELGLDGLRVSRSYLTFVEAHRSKG